MAINKKKEARKVLETKRRELLSGTSDREEILIENAAEDFDRLQQQMNREVAIRNLDRESKLLKEVQAAHEARGGRFLRHVPALRGRNSGKAHESGAVGGLLRALPGND